MFFSAKQLHEHFINDPRANTWALGEFDGKGYYKNQVTMSRVKKYVKACKQAILQRQTIVRNDEGYAYITKWIRPWDVVPKLRNFSAPEGEYSVGVEIEMGFNSQSDASFIANKVGGWNNIALDYEGGRNPIEATFPPMLYSKVGSKSQPFRYLKLLRENEDKVFEHNQAANVGTHVNVGKGGVNPDYRRIDLMTNVLDRLSTGTCLKYFGRARPYGYCYHQDKYVEFKLFNSTTDGKKLRKYIHVAVALAEIIYGSGDITADTVTAALKAAHSKR